MTSLRQVRCDRENSEVAWQPGREHQSLRIFDLHNTLRSRIPVPVDKQNVNALKASKPRKLDDETSKIPVYKSTPREVERKTPALGKELNNQKSKKKEKIYNFTKNTEGGSKARKTIKMHGLELTSLPEDLFDRTELESLILSPERESCLDVSLFSGLNTW